MQVTLYTKGDCGLCHQAEAMLQRLRKRLRFDLELVDIESDPAMNRRYWARVPVVTVDGEEVAVAPLDERDLGAALSRRGSKRPWPLRLRRQR